MHMKLVAARLDDERAAHHLCGFVQPVEILQRKRQVVERVGIVGAKLERLAIDGLGLLGPLQLAQAGAEIVPGIGKAWHAARGRGDRTVRHRQNA